MKKVVFFNAKGGTGKTTLCYTFGWYLALRQRKKVLMLDFDPQVNLGQSFGLGKESRQGHNLDSLIKNYVQKNRIDINNYIIKAAKNLDFIPAYFGLARTAGEGRG